MNFKLDNLVVRVQNENGVDMLGWARLAGLALLYVAEPAALPVHDERNVSLQSGETETYYKIFLILGKK